MVNIIIPAYNAHKTIRQAIASVAIQDEQEKIKLTIVDDCSAEPYDYLLDDFKYLNINILRKEINSGPGQARQYGIDHTTCEYLIFLDADDCLYASDSVKKLLSAIENGGYDAVSSAFLEENADNSGYFTHQNSLVWMHGKIYRTQYIKERNIRFSEIRGSEDQAFNMIILNTAVETRTCFIEDITYVWKNNRDSVTRCGNFVVDTFGDYVLNCEYALKESIRLNTQKNRLVNCALSYLISFYGYYLMFLREKKEKAFINDLMSTIKSFYKSIPAELKKEITPEQIEPIFYQQYIINSIISQNIIMTISIFEFIKMIKN